MNPVSHGGVGAEAGMATPTWGVSIQFSCRDGGKRGLMGKSIASCSYAGCARRKQRPSETLRSHALRPFSSDQRAIVSSILLFLDKARFIHVFSLNSRDSFKRFKGSKGCIAQLFSPPWSRALSSPQSRFSPVNWSKWNRYLLLPKKEKKVLFGKKRKNQKIKKR